MRVVAGTAGGRRLRGPASQLTRPTTDKVREAVFNSLESMDVVDGSKVLDLFAGTGACGIEALSRGASLAIFVDNNKRALQVVRENLAATELEGRVVQSDAITYLKKGEPFDLVFADPPYEFDDWEHVLELVNSSVLVCESDGPIEPIAKWESLRAKKYGDTMVTIFQRKQNQ